MKRYLLTAGDNYYPSRGTGDWIESFDCLEEAKEMVCSVVETNSFDASRHYIKYMICDKLYDWFDIIDLENWKEHE